MDSNAYALVQRIFEHARRLDEDERAAFLNRECELGTPIREDVDSLLRADADSALFSEPELEGIRRHVDGLTASSARSSIPDRVGPYRILRKLGAGGMGVVYEAQSDSPSRIVALKLLPHGVHDERSKVRFALEHQALARLSHPHVATLYTTGITEDSTPYFVMERIDGPAITSHCDRARLTLAERLRLFLQVCEGVAHAHRNGVLHRDLKPTNILVEEREGTGSVRIIDFGIAKLAHDLEASDEPMTLTSAGSFLGTPDYMSPEQAGAVGVEVDTRSDVYSLGAVLYELLCGLPPFAVSAKSSHLAETLRVIREDAPRRPSERWENATEQRAAAESRGTSADDLRATLRRELEWIPLRALRKDPVERYESVQDLASDVERYLAGQPLEVGPDSVGYRLRKGLQRHRVAVFSAAAVVMGLVIAVIGTTHGLLEARHGESVALEAEKRESAARERAELDGSRANLIAAHAALRLRDPGSALERLNAVPEHLRHWEWRMLRAQCDDADAVISLGARIGAIAFDRTAERLAVCVRDGTLAVCEIASRRVVHRFPIPHGLSGGVWFCGGGRHVGFFVPGTYWNLASVELETGEWTHRLLGRDLRAEQFDPAWLAVLLDGPCPALLRQSVDRGTTPNPWRPKRELREMERRKYEWRYQVLDTSTQEVVFERFTTRSVNLNADGTKWAVAVEGHVEIWDVDTKQRLHEIPVDDAAVTAVHFVLDGTKLAVVSGDGAIRLFELGSSQGEELRIGHTDTVETSALDPERRLLATGAQDGDVRLWSLDRPRPPDVVRAQLGPIRFDSTSRTVFIGRSGQILALDLATRARVLPDAESLGGRTWWGAVPSRELGVGLLHGPEGISLFSRAHRRVLADAAPPGARFDVLCTSAAAERMVVWTQEAFEVWDVGSGERVCQLNGWFDQNRVLGGSISDDGAHVALRSKEKRVRIWDGRTGELRGEVPSEPGNGAFLSEFTPDGSRLITSNYRAPIFVWNPWTLEQEAVLEGHGAPVLTVEFDRSGQRMISACQDRTARVWDLESGQALSVLGGHRGTVEGASFHPLEQRIVTGSYDGTVRLWDAQRAEQILVVERLPVAVRAVGFSPDGRFLAAGTERELYLWEAASVEGTGPR